MQTGGNSKGQYSRRCMLLTARKLSHHMTKNQKHIDSNAQREVAADAKPLQARLTTAFYFSIFVISAAQAGC